MTSELKKAMYDFLPPSLKMTDEERKAMDIKWKIEREEIEKTYIPCIVCGYSYSPETLIANKCQQCRKKEKIEADELRRAEEYRIDRIEQFKINMPKRYSSYTFENYIPPTPEAEKMYNMIKRYASSDKVLENGNNLVLSGSVGTGKTMLAICVLRERFINGDNVEYTTISEIITTSRHAMSYGGNIKSMLKYYNAKHLVIDEIGRQSGSENELNILFEILNKRYNNILPTILITNKSGIEIEKYLGAAIVDRMNEVNTVFLDMSWKSYRSQ